MSLFPSIRLKQECGDCIRKMVLAQKYKLCLQVDYSAAKAVIFNHGKGLVAQRHRFHDEISDRLSPLANLSRSSNASAASSAVVVVLVFRVANDVCGVETPLWYIWKTCVANSTQNVFFRLRSSPTQCCLTDTGDTKFMSCHVWHM